MNDILLNNSDIKFIPRFLFDDFDKKTYTAFLTNEKLQGIVINEIINFIKVKIYYVFVFCNYKKNYNIIYLKYNFRKIILMEQF